MNYKFFFKQNIIIMKFFSLIVFLFITNCVYSCCVAFQYRLFPVGESENQIILIEILLTRYCENGDGFGEENEVWWTGEVNLKKYSNGKLELIQKVDSINIKVCDCGIDGPILKSDKKGKSEYFEKMMFYYTKAYAEAQKLPNFTKAKTKNIQFNDSLNYQIIETDSSQIIKTNDKTIEIKYNMITSCFPSFIKEKRIYETQNYEITILRLSCVKIINKKEIKNNTKKFKKIETAFWDEETPWHSVTKDFIFVKEK